MTKCYVCGRDVTKNVDCESRMLGGGRLKYICFDCIRKGNEEVWRHTQEYFDSTYEGKTRLANGRRKRREK